MFNQQNSFNWMIHVTKSQMIHI